MPVETNMDQRLPHNLVRPNPPLSCCETFPNTKYIAVDSWQHPASVDVVDASHSLLKDLSKRLNLHAENDYAAYGSRHRSSRLPAAIRNLKIGACLDRWSNPDYLSSAVGVNQPISVHASVTPMLDFLSKNFSYVTMSFGELIERLVAPAAGDRRYYYYRAISVDNPRSKEPANFFRDFPGLADDFTLPDFIETTRLFSSVLRLSSPSVKLWLHYDIMDNILIHVHGGRRTILLFHPHDAKYLYMQGDKSSVREFFPTPDFDKFPLLRHCRPYIATLNKGDAIFIPALWLHYVVMDDADENDHKYSIAVNIFWRHLEPKFYSDRDAYGNKDLLPAEKAFDALNRACKAINGLPEPYRTFYSDRAKQLVDKTLSQENDDAHDQISPSTQEEKS